MLANSAVKIVFAFERYFLINTKKSENKKLDKGNVSQSLKELRRSFKALSYSVLTELIVRKNW